MNFSSVALFLSLGLANVSSSTGSVRNLADDHCHHKYEGMDPLKFTIVEGDATALVIEDDIKNYLAELDIPVELVTLDKDSWNAAQTSGDFHMSFTETWGSPYDPHSYALGWIGASGGEGHDQAFSSFDGGASKDELYSFVKDAVEEEDRKTARLKWKKVHQYYHDQAVMLPMWGKRVPTLMSSRLTGYRAGHQQFDYPVHKLIPMSGSSTITIAPGAQSGLFTTIGRLDPHTYRPNEFFANNWVYEGLVTYGEGGQVLPALALSWKKEESGSGEKYTFTLRDNVSFHDGTSWDCNAAKMNFDHVFAGELKTPDWHGWYGVPLYIDQWECEDTMTFTVTTSIKYGPFLQELAYIRPLRMLSPAAFAEGVNTDPYTHNSCHVGWGTVGTEGDPEYVVCAGIAYISGTGPFSFASRNTVGDIDTEVVFTANKNHWDGEPAFDSLKIVRYEDSNAAKTALLNGELDVIWGSGVLPDKDIAAMQDDDGLVGQIQVFHSRDFQNVIMLLNSGNPPLNDINLRKTIIHAIDKSAIVEKELGGLQEVVDNVFPRDAPNCDLDLTPRWDYDIEKARLLVCEQDEDGGASRSLTLGLGLGGLCLFIVAVGAGVVVNNKRKKVEAELIELRRNKFGEDA